jgi:catechol 2,3-dioxygenase-like lactoylglutathione lyase family enzyme
MDVTSSQKGVLMYFEHAALNVPDPNAMSEWYVAHCGVHVVSAKEEPPYTQFLADATGRVIFEIYSNPEAPIPDYGSQHPLCLHLAFAVEAIDVERDRLLDAGATLYSEQTLDNGSRLVMLRDPWGIPLQLVKRSVSLIR